MNKQIEEVVNNQKYDSNQSFIEEPLCLLSVDRDPKTDRETFTLNQEALQVLKEIQGDLGVFSVCGLPKTGKSFLLNLILNRFQSTGFRVYDGPAPSNTGKLS